MGLEFKNMENQNKHPYIIFIAIIIAGLMVSVAIMFKGGLKNDSLQSAISQNKQSKESAENKETRKKEDVNIAGEGDDPVLGNPDAPITLTIFGDFQCHFCRKLELEIKPQIIEKYVKTGKVKIIARDFPFLDDNSVLAAEAADCALEQNKYWEFSYALHKVQDDREIMSITPDALKEMAANLNLSIDKFDKCLDSNQYFEEVNKDFEDGKILGITGTPTSFINKEVINGAEPFSEFAKVIDALLAETKR